MAQDSNKMPQVVQVSRLLVENIARVTLTKIMEDNLREYMATYDTKPENWQGFTELDIQTDVLEFINYL